MWSDYINRNNIFIFLRNRTHVWVRRLPGIKFDVFVYSASSTSLWPEYNTDYSLLLSKDPSSMEVALSSGFTNDKPKRIIVNARALHHLDTPEKHISANATVKAPFLVRIYRDIGVI